MIELVLGNAGTVMLDEAQAQYGKSTELLDGPLVMGARVKAWKMVRSTLRLRRVLTESSSMKSRFLIWGS
jgi:hypothetical protein